MKFIRNGVTVGIGIDVSQVFMEIKLMIEIFNNLYQEGLIDSDEYNMLVEMLMGGSEDDL